MSSTQCDYEVKNKHELYQTIHKIGSQEEFQFIAPKTVYFSHLCSRSVFLFKFNESKTRLKGRINETAYTNLTGCLQTAKPQMLCFSLAGNH